MNKARKRQRDEFKKEEVIVLIQCVETHPIIWDLSHKKHFDSVALKRAWDDVAGTLEKDVNSCKNVWKSVKSSNKYYSKTKQKRSGSSGGVPLQTPAGKENVLWEYAPYLSFLPKVSTQRQTHQSQFAPVENGFNEDNILEAAEQELIDELELAKEDLYNYDQKRPAKKRKVSESSTSTSQKMCEMLESFLIEKTNSTPTRPILAYWESELNMISPEDAAAIEHKMTQLLWTEKSFIALRDHKM